MRPADPATAAFKPETVAVSSCFPVAANKSRYNDRSVKQPLNSCRFIITACVPCGSQLLNDN